MDDEALQKQAVEELLLEAKRGKERSSSMGPSGWQKNLIPMANKRFLQKTIESTVHSQKRQKTSLPTPTTASIQQSKKKHNFEKEKKRDGFDAKIKKRSVLKRKHDTMKPHKLKNTPKIIEKKLQNNEENDCK